MKINKYFSFLLLATPLLSFNIVYFLNNSLISSLFLFLFLSFMPGWLILRSLKLNFKSISENIVYSVGISIGFLMFLGLFINTILPLFNILNPLNTKNIFYSIDFSFVLLSLTAWIRNPIKKLSNSIMKVTLVNRLVIVPPILFLALSIMGANYLNNTGNNIFTMIMLAGIAFYVSTLTIFYKKTNSKIYPFIIYFNSLSLLLMLSLRSHYINGWDINDEFKVFQETKNGALWNISLVKDAYNSCLSITILPTIISLITKFNDQYIFKFFYQIIFAFTPVIIYLFIKKYVKEILAFLSVFFIISQPLFIQPMTGLMRQEIAALFFSLLILTIFNNFSNKLKTLLFIFLGASMVVSHYSTTYVSLLLLLMTSIIGWVFLNKSLLLKIKKIKFKQITIKKFKLTVIPFWGLITVLLCAILWYSVITKISGNLTQVISSTLNSIPQIAKEGPISNEAQQALSLFGFNNSTTPNILLQFENKSIESINAKSKNLYPKSIYKNYPLQPAATQFVQPVIHGQTDELFLFIFSGMKLLVKVFLIIGMLTIIINKILRKKLGSEFIIFTLTSFSILLILLVDPTLALNYNVSRLYFQLLIFLSLVTLYGGIALINKIKIIQKYNYIYIFGIFYSILFLFYSGFVYQFVGGYAFVQLNNYGSDYNKFYIHKSEVASALWLNKNRSFQPGIVSDELANLRLVSTLHFGVNLTLLPALIQKSSYVYADYANVKQQTAAAYYQGNTLLYKFPTEFLNNNKNRIYNNGESEIYK